MRRLIFFSGGVESTAYLSLADKTDILLVMNPVYPDDFATYNPNSIASISTYYGMQVQYVGAKVHIDPPKSDFVNQRHPFFSLAHLWVEKDKSISEVWTGRHLGEPGPDAYDETYRLESAWKILHPNVPWIRPLSNLTKLQQWMMIPKGVKKYVSTCIKHSSCGLCFKCIEFDTLVRRGGFS